MPNSSNAVQSSRIVYRRLTYSCHVPHFLLQDIDTGIADDLPVFKSLGLFQPPRTGKENNTTHLCQITSSVLLTFFLPEKSTLRLEEIGFLNTEKVLWNILTIDCTKRGIFESDSDDEHAIQLTPVAGLLAAIHGAICVQIHDERRVLEGLNDYLRELDDDDLFDDEHFTKSKLYHWTIQKCDLLCLSLSSTLQFLDKLPKNLVQGVKPKVHPSEIVGIEHWEKSWVEDAHDLRELREEFLACRQGVQERVSQVSSYETHT